MSSIFIYFIAGVALVILMRWRLLYREVPAPSLEDVGGAVYRVGEAHVVDCGPEHPAATVLCMHGFVENLKYFTEHYRDADVQLVLINSGDYHLPIADPQRTRADWAHRPDAPLGTILYDAQVLVQALEHLPRSQSIRVHGHSRGGAVVMQASLLRPDLFEDVEVVLEAPVLPQARPRKPLSERERWFMPLFFALWRRAPINDKNKRIYGRLDIPRKRALIEELPFNGRRVSTLVTNQRDIEHWMRDHDAAAYRHLARGVILVPDDDRVLDGRSMKASATQAANLKVVEVAECSHFALQDRPEVIPPVIKLETEGAGASQEESGADTV